MIRKNIKIKLASGLEARPVALLVQVASQYNSNIFLESDERKINAKSIMGMMSLRLMPDEQINVIADGADEAEATNGIERFLINVKE